MQNGGEGVHFFSPSSSYRLCNAGFAVMQFLPGISCYFCFLDIVFFSRLHKCYRESQIFQEAEQKFHRTYSKRCHFICHLSSQHWQRSGHLEWATDGVDISLLYKKVCSQITGRKIKPVVCVWASIKLTLHYWRWDVIAAVKRIRKSAPPSILFLQLIGVANLLTPVYSSYFIAQPLHMRRMRPLKKQTVLLKPKPKKQMSKQKVQSHVQACMIGFARWEKNNLRSRQHDKQNIFDDIVHYNLYPF